MAWPLTPFATFVSNSVPRISAAFLNQIQTTTNDLFNGLITLRALAVDGTGGATIAPGNVASGAVTVSRTVSATGAALPMAPVVPWGQLNKEQVCLGAGQFVWSAGTLSCSGGFNIHALNRVGAGHYEITLSVAPTSTGRCWATANGFFNAAEYSPEVNSFVIIGGRLQITILMWKGGVLTDGGFVLGAFGG